MRKIKPWRVNVYVWLLAPQAVLQYRDRIQVLLQHLGWLYKLEYATSFCDASAVKIDQPQEDLYFFRSTDQTPILGSEFQRVIKHLFDGALNPFVQGVSVDPDSMKNTKLIPFPDEYWRMLNYPYLEHYTSGEKTLFVEQKALDLTHRDDLE